MSQRPKRSPQTYYQAEQGLHSFVDGMRQNTAQVQTLLKPSFLASSQGTAPAGNLATGTGRTRAVTTPSANKPTDSTTLRLQAVSGTLSSAEWIYSTKFKNPPTVTFSLIGPPAPGVVVASVHIAAGSPGPNGCTINSVTTGSGGADTRQIQINAAGNPD